MEPDARQHFLRNLNEPPQLTLRVPAKTVRASKKKAPRRAK
jgi:hypothetical protein